VHGAVNEGILSHDPFYGFKPGKADVVHKSLTKEELDKFMLAEPRTGNQQKAKDLFIFAVFTGLSLIDMKNLSYDEIKTMEDGSKWIVSRRQKTGVAYRVRLLDIPLSIINKYKGTGTTANGRVLDVPCKMAVYRGINAIAKRCGIDKRLGIHVSRHRENSYHLLINQLSSIRFSIGNDLETSELLFFSPFCL
jgi:integrase